MNESFLPFDPRQQATTFQNYNPNVPLFQGASDYNPGEFSLGNSIDPNSLNLGRAQSTLVGNQPVAPQDATQDFLGTGYGKIATGLNVASNLVGAYTGLKGLGLARDQYRLEREAFNLNANNQIATHNANVTNRADTREFHEGRQTKEDFLAQNTLATR